MKKITSIGFCIAVLLLLSATVPAQKKNIKKGLAVTGNVPVPTETPLPAIAEPTPSEIKSSTSPKRNARPNGSSGQANGASSGKQAGAPNYFYEFVRPGFPYGRVLIEHDESGKGKISFLKEGFDELISDPIDLSPGTMSKLNEIFNGLDFLASTENYQHERDFTNMGNVTFTLRRDGRERTVKYNWTDNKLAKSLMDAYRSISNEYTWRFEMTMAIENQPLQTPSLMETMDRYVGRGEISDPPHLLPLLEQYSTNERLPLMARNRAAKIVKQIVKASK